MGQSIALADIRNHALAILERYGVVDNPVIEALFMRVFFTSWSCLRHQRDLARMEQDLNSTFVRLSTPTASEFRLWLEAEYMRHVSDCNALCGDILRLQRKVQFELLQTDGLSRDVSQSIILEAIRYTDEINGVWITVPGGSEVSDATKATFAGQQQELFA